MSGNTIGNTTIPGTDVTAAKAKELEAASHAISNHTIDIRTLAYLRATRPNSAETNDLSPAK